MANVSQKCLSIAHALASELKLGQALTVTESFGTTGLPLVRVGAVSAAHAGALVRLAPQSWPLATDILGNAARIESPTVAQVCLELNPVGGAGADVTSAAQLAQILLAVGRFGTTVEIYTRANGTVPGESDITGTPAAVINASSVYGMTGNV